MTIGELKAALRRKPADMEVRYDFVYFYPSGVHSYRGYYDLPAMGYAKDGGAPKVSDVLAMLDRLTSERFYGWKGGEYYFDDGQVLNVAEPGECGDTVIVDVFNDQYYVRLETMITD